MPCYDAEYEEAQRDAMNTVKEWQRQKESTAKYLRLYVEKVWNIVPDEEPSEVAKLCDLLRNIGEDDLIAVLKDQVDVVPEARRVLGWWEEHKIEDKIAGRQNGCYEGQQYSEK